MTSARLLVGCRAVGALRRSRRILVRLVSLGRYGELGQRRQIGDHLTRARLQVDHPRDGRSPLRYKVEVPPRRSLFCGATLEPAEIPTLNGCLLGLVDQLIK